MGTVWAETAVCRLKGLSGPSEEPLFAGVQGAPSLLPSARQPGFHLPNCGEMVPSWATHSLLSQTQRLLLRPGTSVEHFILTSTLSSPWSPALLLHPCVFLLGSILAVLWVNQSSSQRTASNAFFSS